MENDACDDYSEYTKLSGDEKFELFPMEAYSGLIGEEGDRVVIFEKAEIIFAIEVAIDTNGDGTMSCTELRDVGAVASFVHTYLGLHHD
jgi:hypothetical protein